MLSNKKILLGVCGSIAAYKAASLLRLLVKAGAEVKVVMTAEACSFITPLTLATLSKNAVHTQYFEAETGVWSNHVELGLWADLMLIAPISANTLAKLANGHCDNLLTAIYLSARCPVYVAPAMDLDMLQHHSTQDNLKRIASFGNIIIEPEEGELASGLTGKGRMAEPEHIFEFLNKHLQQGAPLYGKKVLITAGPTYEAIDPVRFIGNHSSGKMGFALAAACQSLGAEVTLISGPSAEASIRGVKRIDIQSAEEMRLACQDYFANSDITIMSAAVADYRPVDVATQKIKKNDDSLNLLLEKTTDILAELGQQKKAHQLLIGFALETENEEIHAQQKLQKKNLDMIVLNSLRDENAGFKKSTNKITTFKKDLSKKHFELKAKSEVAKDICLEIIAMLNEKKV